MRSARLRGLIARARVITPNLPEAAALLDVAPARDEDEMRGQAQKLLALGAGAVLIKGGHGGGPESVDLLVEAGGDACGSRRRASRPKTPTAPAARSPPPLPPALPRALRSKTAARQAKSYVSAAIAAADRLAIGAGHGPLHHFHAWW